MASLQDQIDDLRTRLAAVQAAIDAMAKYSDINTLNDAVTARLDAIIADLVTDEEAMRSLENNIIDLREELRTHTH